MFRASPWISYDPASGEPLVEETELSQQPQDMDEDVDMDAPQISTLREEDSPPPNSSPSHTGKFRVKLLVNEMKPGTKFITFNGETGEEAGETDEADEEEDEVEDDEEDQLIDDDDEDISSNPVTPGPLGAGLSARGAAPSTRGKVKGARKRKGRAGAPDPAPLMTAFEVSPSENHPTRLSPSRDVPDVVQPEALPHTTASLSKKVVPKGTTAAQRAPRKSGTKIKTTILIPPFNDTAELSEGYTGTAPSSPTYQEARTPERENAPVSIPSGVPQLEEFNLDSVPLPRYPLPSKPFHVQPPLKIGTGYAPLIPLDRSGKKVRHWRTANREIRGIAGGRWFARSWVGDKDSELASAAAAATAATQQAAAVLESEKLAAGSAPLTLPKLPTLSLSAPPAGRGSGKTKASKAETTASTAASSRSGSAGPDSVSVTPVQIATGQRDIISFVGVLYSADTHFRYSNTFIQQQEGNISVGLSGCSRPTSSAQGDLCSQLTFIYFPPSSLYRTQSLKDSSDNPLTRPVVRYTALLSGVFYGIAHRRSLQKAHDEEKARHAIHERETLIVQAKEAWKQKQESNKGGVVTDPEDPRFDLEKLLAKWESDSK
ncbi:hypothetical protein EW146_g2078 [Bondarzewia mesenterica]|uniref:Uncharacterized protein n=1 Tax=Bondarzewia mesenterica TaxID=1095465 RepID=A0A4V3XFV6_9AGAM|nr:hypothetical protein EW146_g2078 [Bondarzewia mesenterica]